MNDNPLADVIVAFTKLLPDPADDASRRKIASLLGVEWRDIAPPTPSPPGEHSSTAPSAAVPASSPGAPQAAVPNPSSRGASADDPRPLPFRVRSSLPVTRRAPEWLGQVELFPRQESIPSGPGEVEPLFRPDWTRGILSTALASLRPDGPVDVPEIVNRICRGEAVSAFPRVRWATVSRGVQLLIDRGEGMTPFASDQKWLESRLRTTIGSHGLDVLYFSSCPTRKVGKTGARRSWTPYREWSPRVGTTVVALTDLGIPNVRLRERQASPEEWIEFAAQLRTLGCPLVAFVPYPKSRWPSEVMSFMTVLPWDRRTSASKIRSLIGVGLK